MKKVKLFALLLGALTLSFVSCKEKVKEITGITLNQNAVSVEVGKTVALEATIQPEGVKADINWKSADEAIATVENGLVKGIAVGETRVMAEANGFTAEATVTVTPQAGAKPELDNPAAGEVTLVVYDVDGTACKTVALSCEETGNDLGQARVFEAVEGYANYYKLTIALAEGQQNCKVLLTDADGNIPGDWSSQWVAAIDDPTTVEVEGAASLVGDLGQDALAIDQETAGGTIVWITVHQWQDSPCVAKQELTQVTFDVTFEGAELLDAIEAAGGVWLHGPFVDGWNGLAMTKAGEGHYTYVLKQEDIAVDFKLVVGTEYNYTLAETSWDNKALADDGNGDNRKVTDREMFDVVKYISGILEPAAPETPAE